MNQIKKAIAAPTKELNNDLSVSNSVDTTTDAVLDHLERVRSTGSNTWQASCPTSLHKHGDRSQGLSIKQAEDGRVLLHCHAGCSAESIVSAIGLTLADLFPKSNVRPIKRGPSKQALEAAQLESWVVWIFIEHLVEKKPIKATAKGRFRKAVDRLSSFGGML